MVVTELISTINHFTVSYAGVADLTCLKTYPRALQFLADIRAFMQEYVTLSSSCLSS